MWMEQWNSTHSVRLRGIAFSTKVWSKSANVWFYPHSFGHDAKDSPTRNFGESSQCERVSCRDQGMMEMSILYKNYRCHVCGANDQTWLQLIVQLIFVMRSNGALQVDWRRFRRWARFLAPFDVSRSQIGYFPRIGFDVLKTWKEITWWEILCLN